MATDLEKMSETLREAFPYGHPEFLPMLLEKMKLHSDKNHDYVKGGTWFALGLLIMAWIAQSFWGR